MSELAELTQAEKALAVAETVEEVKLIHDAAEAYRVFAKSAEDQNYAATIKLRAAAKGGQMLADDPLLGKGKSPRLGDLFPELSTKAREHLSERWQKVAEMARDGRLDVYLAQTDEITMAGLFKGSAHVGHNSGENEWYTPPELIAAAEEVMGGIDLDPASTPIANKMIGAARIYTKEDNGLEQEWKGRVWLNPPYAQPLIEHFADKLIIEYAKDNVTAACVLVNNATDTYWFQHLADVSNAICFTRGRVRFWHPDRVSAPLQGQAIIYFGDNTAGFLSVFDAFGFVVRH